MNKALHGIPFVNMNGDEMRYNIPEVDGFIAWDLTGWTKIDIYEIPIMRVDDPVGRICEYKGCLFFEEGVDATMFKLRLAA